MKLKNVPHLNPLRCKCPKFSTNWDETDYSVICLVQGEAKPGALQPGGGDPGAGLHPQDGAGPGPLPRPPLRQARAVAQDSRDDP